MVEAAIPGGERYRGEQPGNHRCTGVDTRLVAGWWLADEGSPLGLSAVGMSAAAFDLPTPEAGAEEAAIRWNQRRIAPSSW